MLHVHINHGESDKQSMASNNAKSYDRVFVAGEAAVQRIASGLLEFDTSRLVRIGRPQLDLRREPVLAPTSRRTVLYAPTWEGDADYNNYSSIDTIGREIVARVLAVPDVRLVYKPHPQVAAGSDPGIHAAHLEIVRIVADAATADPAAGHVSLVDADILALMPDCDAMVTDVSSVGLDWLYLRTEQPLLIADRHDDPERLRLAAPVSRCADVLDSRSVQTLTELLAARLEHDELHLARIAMRHHYFDDVKVGDSTTRFLDAVAELTTLRDTLLRGWAEQAIAT
jgi:CDP-glycerol glycerophosphotransferase (TagB/SpsB family)